MVIIRLTRKSIQEGRIMGINDAAGEDRGRKKAASHLTEDRMGLVYA